MWLIKVSDTASITGTVIRSISPSVIQPGSDLSITLTPSSSALFALYQVIETIPQGFTFVNSATSYTNQGNVYNFTQISGTPVTYVLRAPSTEGNYAINGTFKDVNLNTGIISGTTSIRVGAINYDSNNNGMIDRSEAVQAVMDYFNGAITKQEAINVVIAYFGSAPAPTPSPTPAPAGDLNPLNSQGFQNGGNIPAQYTCTSSGLEGSGVSPSLSWGLPPAGTISLALILDDPDAPGGVFTHWVLYNLPASVRSLPEGVQKIEQPATGGIQGMNDFGLIGYGGPCPPPGGPHTYRFILYALNAEINPGTGATRQGVLNAMQGHVLAQAELDGEYGT